MSNNFIGRVSKNSSLTSHTFILVAHSLRCNSKESFFSEESPHFLILEESFWFSYLLFISYKFPKHECLISILTCLVLQLPFVRESSQPQTPFRLREEAFGQCARDPGGADWQRPAAPSRRVAGKNVRVEPRCLYFLPSEAETEKTAGERTDGESGSGTCGSCLC